MQQSIFIIRSHTPIAPAVFRMELAGDTRAITRPGQFINIALDGFYLRRPISVCDYGPDAVTILYKVVGQGTRALSALPVGAQLDVLTGLGNGFDLSLSGDKPLLIGGGVGIPPLYRLAKDLLAQGKTVQAVLGIPHRRGCVLSAGISRPGAALTLVTEDGSLGKHGRVTDWLPTDYSYFYTCGPEPMLRAVYDQTCTSGQLSFEQRMGCGFGACLGCSCQTKYGDKRICKDGPVLVKEEILW